MRRPSSRRSDPPARRPCISAAGSAAGAWLRLPSASSFRGLLSSPGGSINARAELAAAPYVEDLSWRSVHAAAAGPASQARPQARRSFSRDSQIIFSRDQLPSPGHCSPHVAPTRSPAFQEQLKPEERSGPLWDVFRQLQGAGWAPDAGSYTTLVRVKRVQPGKTAEEWLRVRTAALKGAGPGSIKRAGELLSIQCTDDSFLNHPPTHPPLHPQLRASFHASLQSADNLDYTDIFPASSGKDAAARHLAAVHGCALADCVSMGDDDNDLGIAAAVGHAFVPGITAESMREARAGARGGGAGQQRQQKRQRQPQLC